MGRVAKADKGCRKKDESEREQEQKRKQKIIDDGIELNSAISRVVKKLTDGQPQKEVAERICYSQSTLNLLLNGSKPTKSWPLYILLALAKDIGIPLSTLIQAAEDDLAGRESALALEIKLGSAAPRSSKRLQRIVYLSLLGRIPEDTEEDALFRKIYSVNTISYSNPWFWEKYASGDMTDKEAADLLQKAEAESMLYDSKGPDDPPPPFWAVLQKYAPPR